MDFWEFNEHNIDGKGRLVLPSSFRDAFSGGGVLSNLGDHVGVYTPAGWDSFYRKVRSTTGFTASDKAVFKSFVSQFQPDAQNRIVLPLRLRKAVGLEREVALIGMGDHVAIYPTARWHEIETRTLAPSDGQSLADRLAETL